MTECHCFRWVPGGRHEFDCPNNTQDTEGRLNRCIDVVTELRERLGNCAAGPWNTDVEAAPEDDDVLWRLSSGNCCVWSRTALRIHGLTAIAWAAIHPPEGL